MKRLFALLLPLCLLLAGCSRNTQALQEEVDRLWNTLTADGGEAGPCGWLKDKFGVSWQIIPTALGELMGDPNPAKAQSVMKAMLQMKKIDITGLQAAYDQA